MKTANVDYRQLALEASTAFSPTAPIDEQALFAGRDHQIRQVLDAVRQKGQHAIIYGERGVGKTSLGNVLSAFLRIPTIIAPRVNCETQDTFDSVWQKVFEQVELQRARPSAGFQGPPNFESLKSASLIPDRGNRGMTTEDVRRLLTVLAQDALPVVIIDEFDRLPEKPRRAFADAIKTLSDHAVGATVVVVGVADSVEQLIDEHESIERALVQIPMPRMSKAEIEQIINKGLGRLGMSIEAEAMRRIVILSQGLPHYAHLIGLHAARFALDSSSLVVGDETVDNAISKAIDGTQQSIRTLYKRATDSPRKENLFAEVLLSCALAATDEMGFFAAQDVREPMQIITNKKYEIPSFSQHLNDFCEQKKGNILQKKGSKRKFRFRFKDPLMQPFVIMRGLRDGRLPAKLIDRMDQGS
jgi:Cdc6-like AAA superfamily ATPase